MKEGGEEGERGTSAIGRTGMLMDSGPTCGREPDLTTLRYVSYAGFMYIHIMNKLRGRGREGGRVRRFQFSQTHSRLASTMR